MSSYYIYPKIYDVIVIGAGHAGAEAALAAARLGCSVLLLSQNLDTIGQMSCNPAIGGLAKGHVVREIDALGGAMALNTDATAIQFRLLNAAKGPSVRAPRAQCDKKAYQYRLKSILENTENITLYQGTIEDIVLDTHQHIRAVRTSMGVEFPTQSAILCAGTFMNGKLHVGMNQSSGGRMGDPPSHTSSTLSRYGIKFSRFKTGTSPRINGRSIDFSQCEKQEGDLPPSLFSYNAKKNLTRQENNIFTLNTWADPNFQFFPLPCWITYTNTQTHEIIQQNIHQSPMYAGIIEGIGPRYCPSLEDKVVRFPEKIRHQIFIEPEGRDTQEYYLNGVSTSLPFAVQEEFIRSIKGLKNAEILRPGYAVEYDYAPPTQLRPSLETKQIEGLYFAGQINGTSGYEEAAAQGLIAGANAALKIQGKPALILPRDKSYIGVMIDDLVTKGTQEPYRLFTSRAEFRLLLRQDNADLRLAPIAYETGLITQEQYDTACEKQQALEEGVALAPTLRHEGIALDLWLRRTENIWQDIPEELKNKFHVEHGELIETEIKYSGFLDRQLRQTEKVRKLEDKALPKNWNYQQIRGLKQEAIDRFSAVQPETIGQASRIPGITPADISMLIIWLEKNSKN